MSSIQESIKRNEALEAKMRDPHEGNTPAAWTAVIIMILAALVGAIGIALGNMPVFYAGLAGVVVGAVVGKLMGMMGFGQYPKKS